MDNKKLLEINNLLNELINAAPCGGGPCIGHMNCEFGENGCYGESCAIEDVQEAIALMMYKNSRNQ